MTYSRPRHPARPRSGYAARRLAVFAGMALVALVVIAGIIFSVSNVTHTETVTCTVTDKDRTKNADGGSDMRVYTKECGTLQVADSLFDGAFSSSDTYAAIEPGNTYTFDTRGKRIPILSMFPNIIEVSSNG